MLHILLHIAMFCVTLHINIPAVVGIQPCGGGCANFWHHPPPHCSYVFVSCCTGVNVTVLKDPARPAASALLNFKDADLIFLNSALRRVSTDLDAVFGLYNSTVLIGNSNFTENKAKTAGALMAQGVTRDVC